MKQIPLDAQKREVSTKGTLNENRKNGTIPAIMYGADEKTVPLWINEKALHKIVHSDSGTNALITLTMGSESKMVLIKEIQRDVISEKPIHVDFHIVSLKEKIEVNIPIHTSGEAPGVKSEGGILDHPLRELHVKCLPTQIPESIVTDVSGLNIGGAIHVKDLPAIEDVEVLTDPEALVLHVIAPTKVEEEPVPEAEGTEAAEPEVISKGKKEEAEEGAEGEKKAEAPKKEEKKEEKK